MKVRKRWHEFLCWLFWHRWKYIETKEWVESEDLCSAKWSMALVAAHWRYCKRCGVAERIEAPPPKHPMCRCVINES